MHTGLQTDKGRMETALAGSCIDHKIANTLGCGYSGKDIRSSTIHAEGLDLCCCEGTRCNTKEFAEMCNKGVPQGSSGGPPEMSSTTDSTTQHISNASRTVSPVETTRRVEQKTIVDSVPRRIDEMRKVNNFEGEKVEKFNNFEGEKFEKMDDCEGEKVEKMKGVEKVNIMTTDDVDVVVVSKQTSRGASMPTRSSTTCLCFIVIVTCLTILTTR